jgi:hypothetical protein
MHCHLCQREAIDRCYTCGELFCVLHGNVNCVRCATGIVAGDKRADRVSAVRLTQPGRPGWWRPQEAEDYDPPACQECQGLAPYLCSNCGNRYCRDHAGKKGLCALCESSLRGGNVFLAILFVFLGGLLAFGLWAAH